MLLCLATRAARRLFGPLRLAVAALLLWIVLADHGARTARLALDALPDLDVPAEIRSLREQGRYGEALILADAGLEAPDTPARAADIARERDRTIEARDSWRRRLTDLAAGAITGSAAGDSASIEAILGAVAADFFIVGDVRDLVIQASRAARGTETDPVIIALSIAGIATTIAPEIDWAPSVLKIARRMGAMSERFGDWIIAAARRGDASSLGRTLEDSAAIVRRASPAGAMRLLRHVDGPEDARMIVRFLERSGAQGAAALHATSDAGVSMLRQAESLRAAGRLDEALGLEKAVVLAGKKGERGRTFLKSGAGRVLAKPHPLLGVLKGVYKGHAAALLERALRAIDPFGRWIVPVLTGWVVLESLLLLRRITMGGKKKLDRRA